MSKWKNKTDEEKAQALSNSKKNEEIHKPKHQIAMDNDNKLKLEIMSAGELPLRCLNCGPATSKHYTLCMATGPFGGEPMQMATGKCKRCGANVKAFIDPRVIGFDSTFIVINILMTLGSQGRLTDDRKGKVREWK